MTHSDEYFMELAIEQASIAQTKGEVPVGAVFVDNNEVIAASGNAPIALNDPTAHAEIMVIRKAAELKNNYRLGGSVFVTLEPCAMCVGAMIHARIERLIFGAFDDNVGAVFSVYKLAQSPHENHCIEITKGVLEKKCQMLLKDFFRSKRGS
jgi:tRNA(adenine34) deaminase